MAQTKKAKLVPPDQQPSGQLRPIGPSFHISLRRYAGRHMPNTTDLQELALRYHKALPARIRAHLNKRGVSDLLIDFHLLGWNGNRITIPVSNSAGEIVFFKLAKDPEDQVPGPKMMATRGAHAELYGWEHLLKKPTQVVICEGEFDRLVLEGQGFAAVTSTGGAGVFRREWASYFQPIPDVYVCYDRDQAGVSGAENVSRLIPHARIVELPEDVGESGDVTDLFVRLGKRREEFLKLMEQALPLPPVPPPSPAALRNTPFDTPLRRRIEEIKERVGIEQVVGSRVKLEDRGNYLVGLCPFHEDKNPSLAVYPRRGFFTCFACGKRGDVITFIRDFEQLGFLEALDRLDNS
jgi:DNA primase